MDNFTYQYPVRQHFGKGCAERAIKEEMGRAGRNVLLAYGGGSLKRTGLYDRLRGWLHECGKHVVDFGGIRPNPTYAKVQDAKALASVIGEDELSASDKRLMEFGRAFEERFINQGYDENRTIDQTLDLGWELLATLPRNALDRCDAATLDKYYEPAKARISKK